MESKKTRVERLVRECLMRSYPLCVCVSIYIYIYKLANVFRKFEKEKNG